jgi:drug/metabolite transporter (DMT)-like permease
MVSEQIMTEFFYVFWSIPTLVFGAVTIPIAGISLIFIHRVVNKKAITVRKDWKLFLLNGGLFTLSTALWFDAVTRIGAGKTALIDVPLETVTIVFLAWVVLKERLNRLQLLGAIIIMTGVIMTLTLLTTTKTTGTPFGIGEAEAVATAILAGIEIMISVKLIQRHGPLQESRFELLICGIFLQTVWITLYSPSVLYLAYPQSLWLLLMPAIPVFVFFLQAVSYTKIGASLTSVITASNIVLTVGLSAVLLTVFTIPFAAPQNIGLAIIAGVISVSGIIITIFLSERRKKSSVVQGQENEL